MKYRPIILLLIVSITVGIYAAPLLAFADCVNGIDPTTGLTCIIVNPPSTSASAGSGPVSCGTPGANSATCIPTGTSATTGNVSCSAPGANPATCIPSGAATVPSTASTPSATTPTSGTCPNGQPPPAGQGCPLGYTPLEPIQGLTLATNGTTLDFPHLIGGILTIGITVGALMAVLMLTIGGIQYMISESPNTKAGALGRAQAALWGILLIAASWLILHTINPQLLTFNLNPCPSGNCAVTAAPVNNNTNTSAPTANVCSSVSCGSGSFCDAAQSGVFSSPTATCVPNGYFGSINPSSVNTEIDNSGNVIPVMTDAQSIQNVLNSPASPLTCTAMRDFTSPSIGRFLVGAGLLVSGTSGTLAQDAQAYVTNCANTGDGAVSSGGAI